VGLVAASAGISGLILGIIFPPIVASGGFQSGLFALAAVAIILGFIPALTLVRNPPRPAVTAAPVPAAESKRLDKARYAGLGLGLTVGLLAVSALIFAMESSFTSIQPAVYAAAGVDPTLAGLLVSYYSIAAMLAKPMLGWMYDKLGLNSLYITLAVLFVFGLPGMALFHHVGTWVFFILIPIAAISFSVTTVVLPLIVGRVVPAERFSVTFGMVMTGMWIGLAVATPLWGVAFDLTGSYDIAMFIGGAAGLIGLGLCVASTRRAAKRQAAAAAHEESHLMDSEVGAVPAPAAG
jgi:OFA family oxalate/formate antiporter-like MFS transporter